MNIKNTAKINEKINFWSPESVKFLQFSDRDILVINNPVDGVLTNFIFNLNNNKDLINLSVTGDGQTIFWLSDETVTLAIGNITNEILSSLNDKRLYFVIEDLNQEALVFIKLS